MQSLILATTAPKCTAVSTHTINYTRTVMILLRNTATTETPMLKLLKALLPPVVSVLIAVGGGLVLMKSQMAGIEAAMQSMAVSYKQLSSDVNDVKRWQAALFETYYIPTRAEWRMLTDQVGTNTAAVVDLKRMDQMFREDIQNIGRRQSGGRNY